ncbi:UNVERIFIED_CONTAM: hypothetical protein HDU68_012826 [Siphonaria sp. JEL0065]|nr:hypothetical protein HDU68_012826 [Siphonaria sp. JEL0065]
MDSAEDVSVRVPKILHELMGLFTVQQHSYIPPTSPGSVNVPKLTDPMAPVVPPSLLRKTSELSMSGTHNILASQQESLTNLIGAFPRTPLDSSPILAAQQRKMHSAKVSSIKDDYVGLATVSSRPKHQSATSEPVVPKESSPSPNAILLRLILFRKVLLLNDGRDKSLKVLQYVSKVLLWSTLLTHLSSQKSHPSIQTALQSLIPHLSIARKLVRLGNFMAPLEFLAATPPSMANGYLFNLLSNVNALWTCLADDSVTLAKVGIWNQKEWMQTWADRLWLFGIGFDCLDTFWKWKAVARRIFLLQEKKRILGLQLQQSVSGAVMKVSEFVDDEDGTVVQGGIGCDVVDRMLRKVDSELESVEKEAWLVELNAGKLVADFVFCSFDVFRVVKLVEQRGGLMKGKVSATQLQRFQDVAGLISAILGTWKLYSQQKK